MHGHHRYPRFRFLQIEFLEADFYLLEKDRWWAKFMIVCYRWIIFCIDPSVVFVYSVMLIEID